MEYCAYCGTEMELIKGIYYIADKLYCPKCKTDIYIHDDYENLVSYENCQVEETPMVQKYAKDRNFTISTLVRFEVEQYIKADR